MDNRYYARGSQSMKSERGLSALTAEFEDVRDSLDAAFALVQRDILYGASLFSDLSVNHARAFINHDMELVLIADKATNVAGNFNGGGTGNKPICGLAGYEGKAIADFPVIDLEAEIRTLDSDPDQMELGISFNALVDLSGTGVGPNVVMVVTRTLGTGWASPDKYGKTGAAASITEFDIGAYSDSGTTGTLVNSFYIVGQLPSYSGSLTTNQWNLNPINLDILLNGGTMPVTGEPFTGGYPNAKLVTCDGNQCISTDGGLPAAVKMSSIFAQCGGSGNALRSVTAITQLSLDNVQILPPTP